MMTTKVEIEKSDEVGERSCDLRSELCSNTPTASLGSADLHG